MSERSKFDVGVSILEGIRSGRIPLAAAERFDTHPLDWLGPRAVAESVLRTAPGDFAEGEGVTVDGKPFGRLVDGRYWFDGEAIGLCRWLSIRRNEAGRIDDVVTVIEEARELWVHALTGERARCVQCSALAVTLENGVFITKSGKHRMWRLADQPTFILEPATGPEIVFLRGADGERNRAFVPNKVCDAWIGVCIDGDEPVMADRLGDTFALLSRARDGRMRVTVFAAGDVHFRTDYFDVSRGVSAPVLIDNAVVIAIGGSVCRFTAQGCMSFGTAGNPVRMWNGHVLFPHCHRGVPRLAALKPGEANELSHHAGTMILDDRYVGDVQNNSVRVLSYGNDGLRPHLIVNEIAGRIQQSKRTENGFRVVLRDHLGNAMLYDIWNGKIRKLDVCGYSVDIDQCVPIGNSLVAVVRLGVGERWQVRDDAGLLGRPADGIWNLRMEDGMLRWVMLRNNTFLHCMAQARS